MRTETFDNPADFLIALNGKKRTKRGRNTRPDLPSAGRAEATGLTSLIAGKARTWSVAFDVARGYRLYVIGQPAYDTGFLPSELEVCRAAKAMQ